MAQGSYHRPIGVMLLALGAGLAALAELWRMLVFLGVTSFTFVGKSVSFSEPQWGQALWALILAAIWIWVALGFWNVRAYAVQFGIFISMFTIIFGFFSLLFGSTIEAETVPWLLAGAILLYLSYPGVQKNFVEHELSMLTPEQRAAFEQMQAANRAVMQANASAAVAPAPAPVVAPVPAPVAAPPAPVAAPPAAASTPAPAAPPPPPTEPGSPAG